MTRPARRRQLPDDRTPRRLMALIGTLFAFEASLYSVLTPILPHYERTLGASKAALGLLAGAYAGGMIPGSILGGWMAVRAGVRRTTLAGLIVFAFAIAPFGFATDIVVLDVLRAFQGVACGFIWGGALTWLMAASPANRRGAVFGSAFGAGIVGTLLGPAVGTIAVAFGTEIMFGALSVIALALALWARTYPASTLTASAPQARPAGLLRNRAVVLGTWIVTLEGLAAGVVYTLIPLRLSRFGASTFAIGATFVITAALSAGVALWTGRVFDRRGGIGPIAIGLGLAAAMMAALPVPQSVAALSAVTVVAMAGPLTVFVIPASSLVTVAVERAGISLAIGTMLFNLGFAVGNTTGAPTAAGLAKATSDAVPFAIMSALLLATLGLVLVWRREPEVAHAASATGPRLGERQDDGSAAVPRAGPPAGALGGAVSDLGRADAR